MENRIEFYRLERMKILNLVRELNEELLLTKMNFLMGSICFEEFVKLRDSIKFRIDVAREVDAELLENIIAITDSLDVTDDYEPEW